MQLVTLSSFAFLLVSSAGFTTNSILPAYANKNKSAQLSSTIDCANDISVKDSPRELSHDLHFELRADPKPTTTILAPTTRTAIVRSATFLDVPGILKLVSHGNLKTRSDDDIRRLILANGAIVFAKSDGHIAAYYECQFYEGEKDICNLFKKEMNYSFNYEEGDIVLYSSGLVIDGNISNDDSLTWWQEIYRHFNSNSNGYKQRLRQAHAEGRRVIITWATLEKDSGIHKLGEIGTRSIFGSRTKTPREPASLFPAVMTDGTGRSGYMGIIYVCPLE